METLAIRTKPDELALSIPLAGLTIATVMVYPNHAGGYLSIHGAPEALRALLADAIAAIERIESEERAAEALSDLADAMHACPAHQAATLSMRERVALACDPASPGAVS